MFISSNYLGAYALSLANVKQPPYHHFLLNTMETIPVIGVGGVYDANGNWYTFNDVPESMDKILKEYEILQYNNMYDKMNRVDELFEVAGGEKYSMKKIIQWIKNCLLIGVIFLVMLIALSVTKAYDYVRVMKEQQKDIH